MKKRKALISSILTIALCFSLIAGSTFALFTSESEVNVAATSATVAVKANVLENTLMTYSFDVPQAAGEFEIGGTATFDEDSNLALTNMVPGDKAVFDIQIENESNVDVKYRVKWAVSGDLMGALVAKADGNAIVRSTSAWSLWEIPATDADRVKNIEVVVELPEEIGNSYQDTDAVITFVVEAVQANGISADGAEFIESAADLVAFADDYNSGIISTDVALILKSDIDMTGVEWTPIGTKDTPFSGTVDGGGYTITGLSGGNDVSGKEPFGLIGYGSGNVTVSNIKFAGVDIVSGEYASAVMGLYIGAAGADAATYAVTFADITVDGTIVGTDKPGAILGCTYSSSFTGSNKNITFTFENCVNNANVSGDERVGGIAGAISGQFAEDGNNNEVKIIFKNCTNNGDISSTHATYKTGGIVGWMGTYGNYEFVGCANNGVADGDITGQYYYSGSSYPISGTLPSFTSINPVRLSIYDVYGGEERVSITWKWLIAGNPDYRVSNATYYVGVNIPADEHRLTIDGVGYRAPLNAALDFDAVGGWTVDDYRINNPYPTDENWGHDGYAIDDRGVSGGIHNFVITKDSVGEY